MSHLPGNQHIPDALMQLRQATTGSINAAHASAILAAAQTNATLALAYEQRTANMLLAFQAGVYDAREWPHVVKSSIAARLGIIASPEGPTE